MDLSWPLPLWVSVNSCTLKESFLGVHKRCTCLLAVTFVISSEKLAVVAFYFATDVARAYRQLPLDLRDWPLICFTFEGRFRGH